MRLSSRVATAFIVVVIGASTAACDLLAPSSADLRVGDCIDEPDQGSTVQAVPTQPCTSPHDAEVFAELAYPAEAAESYPGDAAFEIFVETSCIPLWDGYTGRVWGIDTEFDIGFLQPTVTSWDEGDRAVTCYTGRYGGGKLVASVRHIGASPLPVPTP